MARKSGIYCILNLENNKKYIGSSMNISRRWMDHKRNLNNNVHINKHLQFAWNKYGKDLFKFFIIEKIIVNKSSELFEREDFYILKFNSINPDYGYNSDMAGDKVITNDVSKRVYKPIVVLNKTDGSFIGEYISIAEVARFLNTTDNRIDRVLNKRLDKSSNNKICPSYKGYTFVYKEEYDSSKDYSIKHKRGCPVALFNEKFEYIKSFKNCKEASSELNIKLCNIIDSKTFGYITHGYYFKTINKDGSFKNYIDRNGNTLTSLSDIKNNKEKKVCVEMNNGVCTGFLPCTHIIT